MPHEKKIKHTAMHHAIYFGEEKNALPNVSMQSSRLGWKGSKPGWMKSAIPARAKEKGKMADEPMDPKGKGPLPKSVTMDI